MPRDFHAAFAAGLLDPGAGPPDAAAGPAGRPAGRRYDVYRNNVTAGLAGAIEAIYPAVAALAGADNVRAVAVAHVRATPPRSPLLFDYGRDFPAFLDSVAPPPFAGWLADVARLERLWLDAWHAADMAPLAPAALAALPAAILPSARLVAHPAAGLLASDYPVVALFEAGRQGAPTPAIPGTSEDALVTRPHLDVTISRLPPGGHAFLDALAGGAPLAAAAESGLAAAPGFDAGATIALALAAGAWTAIATD